mmetsp:Transcript_5931/g.14083  ORF Transcript_5931/g.14083 Transcript_5931/m.14083 type:complete len:207 (+) Transcript_5931:1543-2163(+)
MRKGRGKALLSSPPLQQRSRSLHGVTLLLEKLHPLHPQCGLESLPVGGCRLLDSGHQSRGAEMQTRSHGQHDCALPQMKRERQFLDFDFGFREVAMDIREHGLDVPRGLIRESFITATVLRNHNQVNDGLCSPSIYSDTYHRQNRHLRDRCDSFRDGLCKVKNLLLLRNQRTPDSFKRNVVSVDNNWHLAAWRLWFDNACSLNIQR